MWGGRGGCSPHTVGKRLQTRVGWVGARPRGVEMAPWAEEKLLPSGSKGNRQREDFKHQQSRAGCCPRPKVRGVTLKPVIRAEACFVCVFFFPETFCYKYRLPAAKPLCFVGLRPS